MDGPKPQICDQHGVDKENGVFDANLMRLPILEVGSEQIGQSRAIERYVAKDLGLMGKGKIQEAQIDAYCEHIRDLRDAYNKGRFHEDVESIMKDQQKDYTKVEGPEDGDLWEGEYFRKEISKKDNILVVATANVAVEVVIVCVIQH